MQFVSFSQATRAKGSLTLDGSCLFLLLISSMKLLTLTATLALLLFRSDNAVAEADGYEGGVVEDEDGNFTYHTYTEPPAFGGQVENDTPWDVILAQNYDEEDRNLPDDRTGYESDVVSSKQLLGARKKKGSSGCRTNKKLSGIGGSTGTTRGGAANAAAPCDGGKLRGRRDK